MPEERTLGQLVTEASEDISALVRYELALAKAEVRNDVRRGALAGGLLAGVAVLGFFATFTFVVALGFGLVALGLSEWVAFLVLTLLILVLAGLLGLVAFLQVRKIKPPQRAIRSTKLSLAAVRGSRGAGNGTSLGNGTGGGVTP